MTNYTVNRRTMLTQLAAMSALLATGANASASGDAMTVGVIRLPSQSPSFIAFDRGYYSAEGLNVTFKYFEAAQALAVAVASGGVDYGLTAITGGLVSLAANDTVRIIGGALAEEKGKRGHVILASNKAYESGLTSPEKLPNHSFGITTAGSSFDYMGYKIAQACGFDVKTLTMRPLQKVGALIGALGSNQIDCLIVQPGIAKKIVSQNQAKEIGLVSDYVDNYQVTTLFTSKANAANRRRTEAFIRAYSRAIDDYNNAFVDKTTNASDVQDLCAILHRYIDRELPESEAKANLVDASMRINKNLTLHQASCLDQLNWIKNSGMMTVDVTEDQLFDTSFVKVI